jgi:hypothetical protein
MVKTMSLFSGLVAGAGSVMETWRFAGGIAGPQVATSAAADRVTGMMGIDEAGVTLIALLRAVP